MPKPSRRRIATDPIVEALGHPLRIEILRRSAEPVSPKELAESLGEPLGNVGYHCRVLLAAGLLQTVRTVPVRGALQKFNQRSPTAKRKILKVAGELEQLADAL